MCVSGCEGIIFRLETFSHSLFLQAPDKQKGKEKECKTEIQRSRNVKSVNQLVPFSTSSSGEGVFTNVRQESGRVVGVLQTT